MNNFNPLVIGEAAIALFSALSAQAQNEGDEYVIDEVLVTAEKRDSSLQDTPLSVSVLSGDEMEAIGISTIIVRDQSDRRGLLYLQDRRSGCHRLLEPKQSADSFW